MRISHPLLLAPSLLGAGFALAAPSDERIDTLFRPPLGELMALSPDGRHLAYTATARRDLAIVILNVANPGPKRTFPVAPERHAADVAEPPPVRLRFLRWATPGRLVFAPVERVLPLPPSTAEDGRSVPHPDGPVILAPIMAADADGRQRGTLVDARDFTETPDDARRTLGDLLRGPRQLADTRSEPTRWRMPHLDILGFLPHDRDQLIIQTRGAYGIPKQHMVDVRTGSVREFGGDWPLPPEEPQVFDWFRLKVVGQREEAARPATLWRDEELARLQRELGVKFPRRIVEILDWSETRARVLLRVTGGRDPGRVFVWQRPEDLLLETMPRAPWLDAATLHDTRFFEFTAPEGARLSGYLTWPDQPSAGPPPLLVVFPSGFPGGYQPAWDPEAQLFADLGFVVARLNHRGPTGARPEYPGTARTIDRTAVDDARRVIDWIAGSVPGRTVDLRRVATLGRGIGGFLAVRALQLEPAVFHAGIAVDAPMDLRAWLRPPEVGSGTAPAPTPRDLPVTRLDQPEAEWERLSVQDQAETLTQPLLLLVEPGRSRTVDAGMDALRTRLTALGRPPEHLEFDADLTKARPAVYRKIGEFLNLRLPAATVKAVPPADAK